MEEILQANVINLRNITGTRNLLTNLSKSLDTPLNGSTDPYEVLEYFQNKPLSLLIKINGRQAALIGFSQNLYKAPNHWLTTTLVFTPFRGSMLNLELKRSVAHICLQNNIPLGAIIRDWNLRSFNAMRKAFPLTEPTIVPLKPKSDNPHSDSGWFFDFNNTILLPPTIHFNKMDTNIKKWWITQKQPDFAVI
jgi:hypothetical protein